MRKHVKLLAAMLALLASAISASFASDYNYSLYYHSKGDTAPGVKMVLGVAPDATDNYDGSNIDIPWSQPTPSGVNVALHHASEWSGPTDFYVRDVRKPIPSGGTTVIDKIYLWATPDVSSQNLHLYFDIPPSLTPGLAYTLSLVNVPNVVSYSGPRQWGLNSGDIVLPYYATADGTTGYEFQVTMSAPVPEASSLMTLISGLVGTAGFALRRRR